jgi:hypothetical protein
MSYKQLIEVEIRFAEENIRYSEWQDAIAKAGGVGLLTRMYKSFGLTYNGYTQTSIPEQFIGNGHIIKNQLWLTFLLLLKEYCK